VVDLNALRIPKAAKPTAHKVLAVIEAFCDEHLDEEYTEICARMTAKLARKRPSPLQRGRADIWAAGVVYAVGQVNFLFDPAQRPHLSADQLSESLGVKKTTMANKATLIRGMLGVAVMDPEFCRHDMLQRHPYAWIVAVDGIAVDVRALPEPVQDEARRRGLVPPWTAG
jgi:hypothetical protein